MEIQTRIGLGGTAFFTVAGLASPIVSWWVAAPIMLACVVVAGWGFWPAVSETAGRLHGKGGSASDELAPMHKVVEHVADCISDKNKSKFWPEARRAIRQAALDGQIKIYGHKSEETGNPNATSWSLVRTPIPSSYWQFADIAVLATGAGFAEEFAVHTFPHQLSDGRFTNEKIPYYAKTSANWIGIIKIWPQSSTA
jgi:hypothetical protein